MKVTIYSINLLNVKHCRSVVMIRFDPVGNQQISTEPAAIFGIKPGHLTKKAVAVIVYARTTHNILEAFGQCLQAGGQQP